MWFESFVEVACAYAGIDYRENDEDNRNDSEDSQTLSDGQIIKSFALLVHSSQFEYEVCQAAEEEEDGSDHSELVFSPCPECSHE